MEDTEPRVQRLFQGSYRETGMGPQGLAGAGFCVSKIPSPAQQLVVFISINNKHMYIPIWILILAVIVILYFLDKRFGRLEGKINRLENPDEDVEEDIEDEPAVDGNNLLSYQANICIEPNWIKIIRLCFPEIKSGDEAWKFVEGLYKDRELKLKEGEGLFQKNFNFIEFYDSVSGLNPIWSEDYKGFLDEPEIDGKMFHPRGTSRGPNGGKLWDAIHRYIRISPFYIGFEADIPMPDVGVLDKDKFFKFPYYEVTNFFTSVQKNYDAFGGGELMVKTFPKKIQELFDKYEIKYDPWYYDGYGDVEPNKKLVKSKWLEDNGIELYDQKMKSHTFRAQYCSITIRMKFFDPADR